MVTAKNMNSIHSGHKRLVTLLSAWAVGILLAIPGLAQAEGDGVALHGFADVGFSTHSKDINNPSPSPKGFNVGSLDFYLTPQFDDNMKGLIELIFETTSEGDLATDLERVQVGYTLSDNATIWAGRFHTPYGYWNTGFHHGAQIQTAVSRPRFLDFEDKGGIVPAHMVGLWGTGKVNAGDGKFTYDVFVGNGPKIAMGGDLLNQTIGTLNIQTAGDNNNQAMVGANLGYEFSGMADGLRLAAHTLRGDVQDDSDGSFVPTSANITEVSMVGGSIVYQANDWEVLGEYYRFSNKDKSGGTGSHSSWADYLQVGKAINGVTPFLRLEKTVLNQADNYFNLQDSGQSYTRQALGLKYDVNAKAALKLEWLNSKFVADSAGAVSRTAYGYHSLLAQYTIRF